MGSINDWAAKAAEKIVDEVTEDVEWRNRRLVKPTAERIAAIIAWYAKPLEDLVKASYREHDDGSSCDAGYNEEHDTNYECTCGADDWNARVDAAIDGIEPDKQKP